MYLWTRSGQQRRAQLMVGSDSERGLVGWPWSPGALMRAWWPGVVWLCVGGHGSEVGNKSKRPQGAT